MSSGQKAAQEEAEEAAYRVRVERFSKMHHDELFKVIDEISSALHSLSLHMVPMTKNQHYLADRLRENVAKLP